MVIVNLYIVNIQDYLCNAEAYNVFKEKDHKCCTFYKNNYF